MSSLDAVILNKVTQLEAEVASLSLGGVSSYVNDMKPINSAMDMIVYDDGTTWLKTGVVESDVSSYPDATSTTDMLYDGGVFSIAAQEPTVRGMTFNPAGTKMFIVGGNSIVYAYTLSTAYDISTASYDNVPLSIDEGYVDPVNKISFNDAGTKLIVLCSTIIYSYTLTNGYNLTTATLDGPKTDLDFIATPHFFGMDFNNEGTLLFLLDVTSFNVYKCTLTVGYDLSTLSCNDTPFSVAVEAANPRGLALNSDGTRMLISSQTEGVIYSYTMTSAYDLLTATYDNTPFSVVSEGAAPLDIFISFDDSMMFTADTGEDSVFSYSVSYFVGITTEQFEYTKPVYVRIG